MLWQRRRAKSVAFYAPPIATAAAALSLWPPQECFGDVRAIAKQLVHLSLPANLFKTDPFSNIAEAPEMLRLLPRGRRGRAGARCQALATPLVRGPRSHRPFEGVDGEGPTRPEPKTFLCQAFGGSRPSS